jgi:hypothetical protein
MEPIGSLLWSQSTPLDPNLSQISPVPIPKAYFPKIHLNIILPFIRQYYSFLQHLLLINFL